MEQENAWKGRSSEEAWHLHHLMDLREVSCYVGPGTRHLNSVLRWTALPLTPPPKTLRSLAYEHVLNFVGRLAFLAPFADITLFLWGPQDFSWRGLTTQTHISQTQSSAPWILRHLFSFVLYSPAPGHWALPGLCPAPLEAPTCVPQTRQAPRVWQSALPTLTFASAALAHTAPPPAPASICNVSEPTDKLLRLTYSWCWWIPGLEEAHFLYFPICASTGRFTRTPLGAFICTVFRKAASQRKEGSIRSCSWVLHKQSFKSK